MDIYIIIAGYNCEKYIEKCLDSILISDFSGKVIFVDDGSVDLTRTIVTSYDDPRLLYIFKSNGGVSSARNKGLEFVPNNSYVMFLDADDWYENNAFININDVIVNSDYADYIFFDWNEYHFHNDELIVTRRCISDTLIDRVDIIGIKNCLLRNRNGGSPWAKLFKIDIINDHNIRFIEGLPYAEDYLFNLTYLKYSSTAYYSPNVIYAYNCFQVGARGKFRKNLVDLTIEIENYKKDLFPEKYYEGILVDSLIERLVVAMMNLKNPLFSRKERKEEKNKVKNYCSERKIKFRTILCSRVNFKVKFYYILSMLC